MLPTPGKPVIPVTEAVAVRNFVDFSRSRGAPVEQLLESAGIRPDLLDIPGAVLPLDRSYRFAELACQSLQTEHLGLDVGRAGSLADLGAYGHHLLAATTFGEYLAKGVGLFHTHNSGERLWLTEHGPQIRLNIASLGEVGLGAYQSHLSVLAFTIAVCKKAIGPDWSPQEIGLAYRSRENIPQVDLVSGSRLVCGLPHSYISLPRAAIKQRLALAPNIPGHRIPSVLPLPTTFIGLVEQQIDALMSSAGRFHIMAVAESLGMSKRSLQRAIASEGLHYIQVLDNIRFHHAVKWLDGSDRPVTDIALALGYTDASNFARAFKRRTGISPRAFRDAGLQASSAQIA